MKYLSVTAIGDPCLPFVKDLYFNAFPENERRDWNELLAMIGSVREMQLQLIELEGEVIGFMVIWILDDWLFVEHFAISPEHRGKKYGEEVMGDLIDNKLILEVEPPVSDDARRRIRFYEKNGLRCLPVEYLQPSYRKDGADYPMILMSNVSGDTAGSFNEIVSLIKKNVYFK